ncbi:MAG: isochorismate synthase, partial [Planctomycetota bacterium]
SLNSLTRKLYFPSEPGILELSHLLHLYTPISGKLKKGVSHLDLLKALHPTPAIIGYPKEVSFGYIMELEGNFRNWYAAPLGWLEKDRASFLVAIRSMLFREKKAYFFSGAGIVKESDPQKEWDEINQKLFVMEKTVL